MIIKFNVISAATEWYFQSMKEKELDTKANMAKTKRDKQMEVPRCQGSVSHKPCPKNIPEENMWVIMDEEN